MKLAITTAIAAGLTASTMASHSSVVTFENGWENWYAPQGPGGTSEIVPTGGNPGAHVHTQFENFGIEYVTLDNQNFLGDYTQYSSVTLSIDVKVNVINFSGFPVGRDLILDMRNTGLGEGGYDWSSAWFNLGTLQAGQDWTTHSVTFDPNSSALPDGWGGTGDENQFAEPKLPDHLTFADVMSNIDMLSFSTYTPGFMYGIGTWFDVQIDNISIQATMVPTPGAALALLGVFAAGSRRRRN